jgi:hypothetical protein
MGKPKTSTTSRRTKTRRSHLVQKLAEAVNATSPVKAYTTRRQSGAKLADHIKANKTAAHAKKALAKPVKAAKAPAKAAK